MRALRALLRLRSSYLRTRLVFPIAGFASRFSGQTFVAGGVHPTSQLFAELAEKFSECPSGKNGGDLGEFSPGQMVKEFDDVVFSAEIGQVHGPVETQFGFHLIEITSRE